MSRLRQRFYISPLVLHRDHYRPVVDLFDVAWSWLADVGDRRLVQVFAKPDLAAKLDRDRRMQAVAGETFDTLQELIHRERGAELLRESLARTPDLAAAAREALALAPPPAEPTGDSHAHARDRRPAGPPGPR